LLPSRSLPLKVLSNLECIIIQLPKKILKSEPSNAYSFIKSEHWVLHRVLIRVYDLQKVSYLAMEVDFRTFFTELYILLKNNPRFLQIMVLREK